MAVGLEQFGTTAMNHKSSTQRPAGTKPWASWVVLLTVVPYRLCTSDSLVCWFQREFKLHQNFEEIFLTPSRLLRSLLNGQADPTELAEINALQASSTEKCSKAVEHFETICLTG